jgi:hypothetical protein
VLACAFFGAETERSPMSATDCIPADETPGDRIDGSEKTVLLVLFHDPVPWTVEELGRELGDPGDPVDAVARLAGAGSSIASETSCSRRAPPGGRTSSTTALCSRLHLVSALVSVLVSILA